LNQGWWYQWSTAGMSEMGWIYKMLIRKLKETSETARHRRDDNIRSWRNKKVTCGLDSYHSGCIPFTALIKELTSKLSKRWKISFEQLLASQEVLCSIGIGMVKAEFQVILVLT
jgi:hypothetical protein